MLNQLSDDGHVYYPYELLIKKCQEILGVDREIIIKAIGTISLNKKIVIEDLNKNVDEFRENNKAVYLAKYHFSETSISNKIKSLINTPKLVRKIDFY